MQFTYSKLLPIRLVKITTPDQRYQNRPFDLDVEQCYEQKFQQTDSTRMQFLSDFDFTFKIYDLLTDDLILDITPVDQQQTVADQTFKVFEVEIDFNLLQVGHYYIQVEVFNASGFQIEIHESVPISVKDYHPHTLLFEYRNSYPKSDTIFYDGFVSTIRVEGGLNEFVPAFEDVSFIDQEYNNTLLSSVTYRTKTLYIGTSQVLMPDWIGDRFNDILSLDTVRIDGVYYAKTDGAKWTVNRETPVTVNEKTKATYSIQVQPVTNVGENVYIAAPKNPDDEIRMIVQEKTYLNTGDTIQMAGIFKADSVLWFVHVRTTSTFTLKIGTTNGGAEIATVDIQAGTILEDLNFPFDGVTTVYLSGFDGIVADVRVAYLQLDAPPLSGTINPYKGLGVGSCMRYVEVNPGDLLRDFNLSTGLGNTGTDWEEWAVNGVHPKLPDEGGKIIMGYSETDYPLQVPVNGVLTPNTGGTNTFKLTKEQLPIDSIELFTAAINSQESDTIDENSYVAYSGQFGASRASYTLVKGNGNSHYIGKSAPLGEGADIDNRMEFIVSLWVTRIV